MTAPARSLFATTAFVHVPKMKIPIKQLYNFCSVRRPFYMNSRTANLFSKRSFCKKTEEIIGMEFNTEANDCSESNVNVLEQKTTAAMIFPIVKHESDAFSENIQNNCIEKVDVNDEQKAEEKVDISIEMNFSSVTETLPLYLRLKSMFRIDYCLHFGNGLALLSLGCTEMIHLRGFLVGAHICAIVYYSSIDPPLKTPRYWSLLFLCGHLLMIFKLLLENRTIKFTDTEHEIYCQTFREHGFTPLQFQKLIKCAKFRRVCRGNIICKEGTLQKHTMHLYDGSMEVQQNNVIVGGILHHGFIGSLLRSTHHTIDEIKEESVILSITNDNENGGCSENVSETQEEKQPDSNCGSFPIIIVSKKDITNDNSNENNMDMKVNVENEAHLHLKEDQNKEVWQETVIALQPSNLLVWDRDELLSLLESNASLMNAARSAMTSDLQKRLRMNQKFSSLQRYKDMLSIVVYDNSIVAEEKIRLNQFREENNISFKEHKRILHNLGWTIDEYDGGQKRAQSTIDQLRNLTRFYITRTYQIPT